MQYDIKVRVFQKEPSFGKGVVMLLKGIEKHGSLSAAYQEMGMSSSKAWKILNRAKQDLGYPLVESHSGGTNGGKTIVTSKGKDLMTRYEMMMKEINQATEVAFEKYFGDL